MLIYMKYRHKLKLMTFSFVVYFITTSVKVAIPHCKKLKVYIKIVSPG